MKMDFSKPISLPHLGMNEVPPTLPDVPLMDVAEEPLPNPIEESQDSSPAKAANSPLLFAAGAFFISVWAIANLWWTPIARLISYVQHKSLFEGIEKAQIEKLGEGLKTVIEEPLLGAVSEKGKPGYTILNRTKEQLLKNIQVLRPNADPKEAAQLVEKVTQIKEMIEKLEKEGSSMRLDVSSVKNLLEEAMNLPLYRDIQEERNCYAANFLQILAVKLISADGTEALFSYGKKCLGEELFVNPDRTFSPKDLADQLSGYLNRFSFNVDSFGPLKEGRLIWMAAHPLRAMHGLYSNTHPLLYNATQDNPYFAAHAFMDMDAGKRLGFYYGPGPTGSPFFEHGVLPAYRKFDTFETRFNHQNMHNKGDYPRIQEAVRMESSHHFHAVFSFDKPWAKVISKREAFKTSDDFFASLRPRIKDGLREIGERKGANGLYIPDDLFDDGQVELALNKAQEFCKNLSCENPHWRSLMKTPEGKERMGQMMIHIADSFLMLGLLYKSFDMITPEMIENQMNASLDQDLYALRISGACKQDVDRAIVSNISLRLFYRWTIDPSPLTGEEVCEIAGAVLGRARLVDDRNMQFRRYQILDDLLRFIGTEQGIFKAHTTLLSYRNEIETSFHMEEPVKDGWISSLLKPSLSWVSNPFSSLKRTIA